MSATPVAAVASSAPGPFMSGDPAALVRRVATHPSLVARIDVAHLADDRTTRFSVDAAMLDQLASPQAPIVSRSHIDAVAAALLAASVKAAATPGDLRWRLVLRDAGGGALLGISCDRFGRHGIVDGIPVSMDGAMLIGLLKGR